MTPLPVIDCAVTPVDFRLPLFGLATKKMKWRGVLIRFAELLIAGFQQVDAVFRRRFRANSDLPQQLRNIHHRFP